MHRAATADDGSNLETAPDLGAQLLYPALTPTDIHWVCATVAERVRNLLRRRGLLRDRADDNDCAVRLTPSTALDACRQASLSSGEGARWGQRRDR
ncbi:MAG: hypothetical protein MUF81_09910, partial [Verrucomicrobia bacterium]|nr:hypothetical protein [Verrucomicrobiota bacterium]